MDRKSLGSWGEDKAANYLRRKGYKILERNF
ncbi:MAG: YraN family protein [Oscillospiraceae bacterium]